MRIYVDFNQLTINDLRGFTEILWAVPFMNDTAFNEIINIHGYWNHGLLNKLFYSGQLLFELTNIEECEFVGIPFKFNPNDARIYNICELAKKYGKKVITFYNDDDERQYNLPDNLILFRTSIGRSNITPAEKIFPALITDDCIFTENCKDSIGFCGVYNNNRKEMLENIEKVYPVNKLIRSNFGAAELPRFKGKRDFIENMTKNKYMFCMRGNGNFSYRFYETLCFGRVPILINTDTILPLENIIDWEKHIILLNPEEISDLPTIINTRKFDLKANRELWEEYFSPHGFMKNLKKYLE
jgi:hypothetical protein